MKNAPHGTSFAQLLKIKYQQNNNYYFSTLFFFGLLSFSCFCASLFVFSPALSCSQQTWFTYDYD